MLREAFTSQSFLLQQEQVCEGEGWETASSQRNEWVG